MSGSYSESAGPSCPHTAPGEDTRIFCFGYIIFGGRCGKCARRKMQLALPRLLATVAVATRPAPTLVRLARPLVCSAVPPLPMHLEDLKESLESGEAQLFDVREPGEAEMGMLRDAQLVPLSDLQQGVKPPHDTSLLTYVHCAAGIRVHYAAPILEQMGYERVVPLQEGFASLVQYGFETK